MNEDKEILTQKAWGESIQLFANSASTTHLIKVKKGGYCSRHYHNHRYNKFYVISGILVIYQYRDEHQLEQMDYLTAGNSVTVAPGILHKFEANADTVALEMYWADVVDSDIYRLDEGGIRGIENEKTANECVKKCECGGFWLMPAYNLAGNQKETCQEKQEEKQIACYQCFRRFKSIVEISLHKCIF